MIKVIFFFSEALALRIFEKNKGGGGALLLCFEIAIGSFIFNPVDILIIGAVSKLYLVHSTIGICSSFFFNFTNRIPFHSVYETKENNYF